MATQNPKWVDLFVDWTDAWIRRGMVEPDGYLGWPKAAGAGTQSVPDWYTDNLLGEAMGLRPVVLNQYCSILRASSWLRHKSKICRSLNSRIAYKPINVNLESVETILKCCTLNGDRPAFSNDFDFAC